MSSIISNWKKGQRVRHRFYDTKLGTIVAVKPYKETRIDEAEFYSFEYNVKWDNDPKGVVATSLYKGVTLCQAE